MKKNTKTLLKFTNIMPNEISSKYFMIFFNNFDFGMGRLADNSFKWNFLIVQSLIHCKNSG